MNAEGRFLELLRKPFTFKQHMQKFISFSSDVSTISLAEKISYPFNYTPHKIAQVAANELQTYLKTQTDFKHNFGIKTPKDTNALGKMFGVLVVKTNKGKLGYIAAFSGKLADETQLPHFVPPVFDRLAENGFYKDIENEINAINNELTTLETDIPFLKLKKTYKKTLQKHQNLLEAAQKKIKAARKQRKLQEKPNNQLNINEEFYIREYEVYLNDTMLPLTKEFKAYVNVIENLQQQRKQKSAWVQYEIFKNYNFLNTAKEQKDLLAIFDNAVQNIPGGAGDCCAPKLFQYAFLHDLTPIALAEFWWGKPMQTSVRKHGYFYPACTGKCKPILTHMLHGLPVAKNPLVIPLKTSKEITILFEDDYLLVIDKPHELLSVPGKEIEDSVYKRIKKKYPKATGPLLVHRLDMATSGLLLIAKTKDIHKALQAQFLNKTVQKRYVALLDGTLTSKKGTITLPLRVDLDDRPKQLVCNEHGKEALTKWEVIAVKNKQTKVYFYPITGRTHQLRVHAAHALGLNAPIVGDDLYGKKDTRLCLHAAFISFKHPITLKKVVFKSDVPF